MKYTKKQIQKAITYWENQLELQENMLSNVADKRQLEIKRKDYIDFYSKSLNASLKSYNLMYDDLISESVQSTILENIFPNSYCVYNSNSLTNTIRRKQCKYIYLNEIDKQTKNTDELTYQIMKLYKPEFNRLKLQDKELNDVFQIYTYDIDDTGEIAGNVTYSMLMPNREITEKYVKVFSRAAYLYGYNYMDHRINDFKVDNELVIKFQIDFEATYFSSNVKFGDILYHVTPESNAAKILKYGLIAGNKNSQGFHYDSRVFCFVDKYKHVAKQYASVAGKQSKKFIQSKDLAKELKNSYDFLQKNTNGILVNTHRFALLAIDTAKLKDMKFYRDNTFDDGEGNFFAVYTIQNIKPEAISMVDVFKA